MIGDYLLATPTSKSKSKIPTSLLEFQGTPLNQNCSNENSYNSNNANGNFLDAVPPTRNNNT